MVTNALSLAANAAIKTAETKEPQHCEDYIHDNNYPICLRYFILFHRVPAIDKFVIEEMYGRPSLFAKYKDIYVRVTMASRFGDVGITSKLDMDQTYEKRVYIEHLSEFTDKLK